MTDLDDLRKRVELMRGPNSDLPWEFRTRLVEDLWAAVQELEDQLETATHVAYEPVTAEELDAVIDDTLLSGDGSDIIRKLGPLYRQRKT
jgi:predicted nuclease with TOPRIM domain